MKRHLQCAEQAQSASNLTKYCACHEICKFKISAETPWIASANRKTIRTDSEDNPTMIRPWNRHLAPAASETLLVPSWRRILYGKIQHFAFRLSPKMSPNAAPATKSHTPTSPNTAPATQNESHDWSASHMKRHLQFAEQPQAPSNLTKFCTCHATWISWLIRVTYETSFTMRGATLVTVQHHQILRLPRNSEFKMSAENPWIASANIKTIRPWSEHNPKIKSSSRTRRFGDLTRPILETHFVWKNTTFGARAIYPNFTKCCPCHEKWHSNFTKYCACHEKCTLLFCRLFSLGIYSLLASTL